jgi:hypothetical protein
MQLEAVWPISVRGVALQVLGEVDDHDGLKRAFLITAQQRQAKQ